MAEIDEARRSGSYDSRWRELWELGPQDASKLEVHAMRPQGAVIVTAVQMGMAGTGRTSRCSGLRGEQRCEAD